MEAFFKYIRNPFLFRFFLLTRLPAAFLAGIRLETVSPESAVVKLRYQFLTKNPFGSIYFACIAMAAEMSTGLLAMAHLYQRKPAISMLVIRVESQFFKKATGVIRFTCNQGKELQTAIQKAYDTGESVELAVVSSGHDQQGAEVARFLITWSFKRKG
ncbi:MAG: DUF4442 domain-containing protein [Bacteroidetes bacterium]|nr:DUF4442 domain-containing protein [Bacteroidota bacterium]